jgi:predicted GIY-YIG superfamily endonuclease
MSCTITYKGQKYSEEQFKDYFINNKQEFTTSIAKNKDVMDSFKRKMEGKYNYSAIYCLRNTIDDRCYVGSAKKLNYRLWNHKHKLIKGTHANKHLQNFVNKYGIDSVYFEVLEKIDSNIIEREQYWIDTLKPVFNIFLKIQQHIVDLYFA